MKALRMKNIVKVTDENRMNFLPKHFGSGRMNMVTVENSIYNMMFEKCEEYKGGLWDFYELEVGDTTIPLMVWDTDKPFITLIGQYQEDKVRPLVASFAVVMMTYNHLSWHFAERDKNLAVKLDAMYYGLRDFLYADEEKNAEQVFTPEERSIMYAFID